MKKVVITTGIVAVAGGVITALSMSSCGEDCEAVDKPTVILQFVDKQNQDGASQYAVADRVWYEWTDEATGEKISREGECVDDTCSEWTIGTGGAGTYTYHAQVCGQQYDGSVTVEVNAEGCEVDTQLIDLPVATAGCVQAPKLGDADESGAAREPLVKTDHDIECTLEARASVIAQVLAEDDGAVVRVGADRVYYTPRGEPNGRELAGMCLNEECSLFSAGFEIEGTITVGAEVCGEVIEEVVNVVKTADGCHVDTQTVQLMTDIRNCESRPAVAELDLDALKPDCKPEVHASAFLMPVTDGGDVWLPQPTEALVYIHDDTRHQGMCVQMADNGKCSLWVTGFGKVGRFQAFTETCGVETAVHYSVEARADGCYPKTEFVPVFVNTMGCIQAPTPKGNPPVGTKSGADAVAAE